MRAWAGLAIFLVFSTPSSGFADQNDAALIGLFARLQAAETVQEAAPIEAQIWQIWSHLGEPRIDRTMAVGIAAMNAAAYEVSLRAFDKIVVAAPGFAEGWNKRATVNYLMGNLDASMHDIQQTLAREPRHFGALSGMGLIFDIIGAPAAAVRVLERALALHPHMLGMIERLIDLKNRAKGRAI